VSIRPAPEDYATWWRYHVAKRVWLRSHGGSLIGTLALAVGFGLLTGSAVVLVVLIFAALAGTAVARSRP